MLGQVSRAGTAGDVLAPMVVDALITEALRRASGASPCWPTPGNRSR